MDNASLEGRIALVTGAGSGIGRATSLCLACAGAVVVSADIDLATATETAGAVEAAGLAALPLRVDVTDNDAVEEMVETAVAEFGGLDIAVNNAGVTGPPLGVLGTSPAEWERIVATDLTSVFLCMRAELGHMSVTGRGTIVNVSSGAGLVGAPLLPAYTAAKHGVVGLTRSAALEFARSGIRVNCVCPGSTRTPMLEGFLSGDETAERIVAGSSPIGRLGTPEEVAGAIAWLCSDAASFVVGAAMSVDGGAVAQ